MSTQLVLDETIRTIVREELKKAGFNEKTIEKLRKKFNVSPTN